MGVYTRSGISGQAKISTAQARGIRRNISSPPPNDLFNFNFTNTAFAMAFGGGLDIKLTNRLAVRPLQADYLLSRVNGFTQNNLRIGTGLVVRF
jgi:hypothetical protein